MASARAGERGDLVEAGGKQLVEGFAFGAPHGDQIGERLVETVDDGAFRRAALVFALVGLGDLHHALQRQQAVEGRRRGVDLAREVFRGRKHGGEHRLVDLDRRLHAFALDR